MTSSSVALAQGKPASYFAPAGEPPEDHRVYDPNQVLAALDQNMWRVIALCSLAMACNYAWFFAAVVQGFRDKVVPIPVFCTLFWLVGDGSMVARYDLWFNVIDHWYVKLFWVALVFTVLTELVFLYMTLRFGRRELAPTLTRSQFALLVLAGLGAMWVAWELVKSLIDDRLYIDYFHLANLAGPVFAAAQVLRRGSRAGTTPFIWAAYTLMVASWFVACALWFDGPFATTGYLMFYVVCTACALAMTFVVSRLPAHAPSSEQGRSGPVPEALAVKHA
jgi:hypothetical protein